MEVLVRTLRINNTLTDLNLDCNKIGVHGAQLLAAALPNSTLIRLSMNLTGIGTEGACCIGESINILVPRRVVPHDQGPVLCK